MLGILLGNYRVIEQLGQGGMGVVYVGRHETLGHRVVVKVLRSEMSSNAEMVQRFFNEAQAATAIRNPGIVQVFDFGSTPDGCAYFVMELLEGQSLGARLQQRRLDITECCRIARQIANVLQSAHDAGITHRDLKPDNLFLVPDPEVIGGERVKVLDFGIAKLAGEIHAANVQTRADLVMGTPSYMSPEQCRGAGAVDTRADIYSLGCILFKMLCGRAPFVGEGPGDIIGAHLHVPPPDLQRLAPEVPPELAALVAKMLEKKPDARPQTMAAVSAALEELLRAFGGPPMRPSGPMPMLAATIPPGRVAGAPVSSLATTMPVPHAAAPPVAHTPTPLPGHHPRAPSVAHTPTPLPGHHPRAGSVTGPTPPPGHPSAPAIARVPTPLPGQLPPAPYAPAPHAASPSEPSQLSSTSTTLGGAAGVSSVQVRAGTRRLPWVLGGFVVAGAAAAISIVLATSGSDSPTRESGYDELPKVAQAGAGSDATGTPPPAGAGSGAAPAAVAPTQGSAAPTQAVDTAAAEPEIDMGEVEEKNGGEKSEVASPCNELVKARKWAELEKCADELKATDPAAADKLKRSAQEEAKTAPRIAAFDAAIRAKNLKSAKAELSQVWPESIELPKLKNRYFAAENQAITELAAELERVKDSDCKAYEALLAKEKAARPTRVTTEAARKTPCVVTKCDADALAQRANDEYGKRRYAAALGLYDQAIGCRPDPGYIRKAFDLACENNMRARAKALWKQMTSGARASAKASCTRNGITEAELNAP